MFHKQKETDFQSVQRDFTQRIRRQGKTRLPDNVSEDRMQLYQALNYYSINTIVKSCFPVLTSIVTDAEWRHYMEGFLENTTSRTPYFNQLPKAFLDYFQTQAEHYEYPFLFELAHYEWLELYVDIIDAEVSPITIDSQEALFDKRMCFSPCAVQADYDYPVDEVGESHRPSDKKPFSVIVYRDKKDAVQFMRVNEMTKALIKLIDEIGHTPRRAIALLQKQHTDIPAKQFSGFAAQAILNLVEAGIMIMAKGEK